MTTAEAYQLGQDSHQAGWSWEHTSEHLFAVMDKARVPLGSQEADDLYEACLAGWTDAPPLPER